MYVLSARNKRVSVQLLGKHKIEDKMSRLEELTSASLSYLGVRFPGAPDHVSSILPSKLLFSPIYHDSFFSNHKCLSLFLTLPLEEVYFLSYMWFSMVIFLREIYTNQCFCSLCTELFVELRNAPCRSEGA